MGDMADDLEQKAIEEWAKYDAVLQQANNLKEQYAFGIAEWKTKEGNTILVIHMDDNHVKNCLKHLINRKINHPLIEVWIEIFQMECKKRKLNIS